LAQWEVGERAWTSREGEERRGRKEKGRVEDEGRREGGEGGGRGMEEREEGRRKKEEKEGEGRRREGRKWEKEKRKILLTILTTLGSSSLSNKISPSPSKASKQFSLMLKIDLYTCIAFFVS
jgi:hypothetical protein